MSKTYKVIGVNSRGRLESLTAIDKDRTSLQRMLKKKRFKATSIKELN